MKRLNLNYLNKLRLHGAIFLFFFSITNLIYFPDILQFQFFDAIKIWERMNISRTDPID